MTFTFKSRKGRWGVSSWRAQDSRREGDAAAQRDQGQRIALSPAAQLWSCSRGLAQDVEALKADLGIDTGSLSHPVDLGGRMEVRAGGITAYQAPHRDSPLSPECTWAAALQLWL